MEKCIIGEMIIGEMIIGEMLMFRTNLGTNQSYLNLCFKQPTYKLSHYRISTAALKVFLNVPSGEFFSGERFKKLEIDHQICGQHRIFLPRRSDLTSK